MCSATSPPKLLASRGTSFPRCLLETAINDFCTVSEDVVMNNTSPNSTDSKGGRWKTYKFTGYSISDCMWVWSSAKRRNALDTAGIYPYGDSRPDRRCKDKLLAGIVDRCMCPRVSRHLPISAFSTSLQSPTQSHQAKPTATSSSSEELPRIHPARVSHISSEHTEFR